MHNLDQYVFGYLYQDYFMIRVDSQKGDGDSRRFLIEISAHLARAMRRRQGWVCLGRSGGGSDIAGAGQLASTSQLHLCVL